MLTYSNGWPMGVITVPRVASKDLLASITYVDQAYKLPQTAGSNGITFHLYLSSRIYRNVLSFTVNSDMYVTFPGVYPFGENRSHPKQTTTAMPARTLRNSKANLGVIVCREKKSPSEPILGHTLRRDIHANSSYIIGIFISTYTDVLQDMTALPVRRHLTVPMVIRQMTMSDKYH